MVLHMKKTDQPVHTDFTPRISVIGVGGGGTNAVDNMIAADLQGVEFVVANTDAQQLIHSRATRRIQLGPHITQGLGAGARPEVGRAAAEEAADELYRHLDGSHMVFVTAGMGGGTGTGAAPVIARMARERGILTIGVVTKPFDFEGRRRARAAEEGIAELQEHVDTLIIIPNQNLFRMANDRTTWKEAFKMADQVLYEGVRSVTDLMMAPGQINLDFADIRTVMREMGKAMMGTGTAEGDNRAVLAAEAAINNPLLEDTSMAGARGLLINITGGDDLTLFEVEHAAKRVAQEVDPDAEIIFGSATDPSLTGRIRVSVIATGIDVPLASSQDRPKLVAVNGGVAQDLPPATGRAAGPVLTAVDMSAAPVAEAAPGHAAPLRPSVPPIASSAVAPSLGRAETTEAPRPGFIPSAPARPRAAPARPTQPERTSIFGTVTGIFSRRGGSGVAAPPTEPRHEPGLGVYAEDPSDTVRPVGRPAGHAGGHTGGHPMDRPEVRPVVGEDEGLEIPTFLRRQQSYTGEAEKTHPGQSVTR